MFRALSVGPAAFVAVLVLALAALVVALLAVLLGFVLL
jgi:hypothetical protein